jgi:transcriptional regulator GlxA family with amidase domain
MYRADQGADAAAYVANRMVVSLNRPGDQAQHTTRPSASSFDGDLAQTCQWAAARLSEPLTVADLAAQARMSPRTLARRFAEEMRTTPVRWLTAQRVLEARRLLESTSLSIDEVAAQSGLGTAANLRLHLSRELSTTPTSYRTAFRR